MNLLKDLRDLFVPNRCVHCKSIISKETSFLCIKCFETIEITSFISSNNNSLENIFLGINNISEAGSLFYYQKNSPVQSLLKSLKYKGIQNIGSYLANFVIQELEQNNSRFKNIDFVIPVPLHYRKEKKRGYNQVDLFAKKIATSISAKYLKDGLIKIMDNESQTLKNKEERYKSVKDLYIINDSYTFTNKKILLIDDVLTTGATIISCTKPFNTLTDVNICFITIACVV